MIVLTLVAVVGWSGAVLTLYDTPTPESKCVPFAGTLLRIETSRGRRGRIRDRKAVVAIDSGERTLRSNSARITRAYCRAQSGTYAAGLLDQSNNIITMSLDGEHVETYHQYAESFFTEQWLIAAACSGFGVVAMIELAFCYRLRPQQ